MKAPKQEIISTTPLGEGCWKVTGDELMMSFTAQDKAIAVACELAKGAKAEAAIF